MREALVRIFVLSATISLGIFAILWVTAWIFPNLFSTSIEWWLLPLLFVASFLPRAISLTIGAILPRKRRGRRKT